MAQTKAFTRLVSFCMLVSMVAACSGGSHMSGLPSTPGAPKTANSLAGSVPTVPNASLLRPLDMIATATMALSGTALCATPLSSTVCTGAAGAIYTTPVPSSVYLIKFNLNAACGASAPLSVAIGSSLQSSHTLAGTPPPPTPAPTPYPTSNCYVVAFEGSAGPFVVQGPAIVQDGNLVFAANTAVLHLSANTNYTFFLAAVPPGTLITPPPPTPAPTAPASAQIQPTPKPSPTATASTSPAPPPTPLPTSCPSSQPHSGGDGSGEESFLRTSDGSRGDDGGGTTSACSPCPSSTSDPHSGGDGHGSDSFLRSADGNHGDENGGKTAGCSPCPSQTSHPADGKGSKSSNRRSESSRTLNNGIGIIRDCTGDFHSHDHHGHGNDNNPQTPAIP